MHRREFLKRSGAGAAAAAAVVSVTPAAPDANAIPKSGLTAPMLNTAGATPLVIRTAWPDNAQGLSDHAWTLARRIEAASNGTIAITLSYDASADQTPVKSIAADGVISSDHANLATDPVFAFFAGLPGNIGLNARNFELWLEAGGGMELWNEAAGRHGWKPFYAGHSGTGAGLWTSHEIRSIANISGQMFALKGLANDVARGLGAIVSNTPSDQLSAALQSGKLTGVEPESLTEAIALGLPRAAKHCHTGGMMALGSSTSLYLKTSVWERLEPSAQTAITAATAEHARLSSLQNEANAASLLSVIEKMHDVQIKPMATEVAVAINRISEAIVADLASRDSLARRVAASYATARSWAKDRPVSIS